MISDKVLLTFGESLLLSGIGMLVVFLELIALALMIIILSKLMGQVTGKKRRRLRPPPRLPSRFPPQPQPQPLRPLPAPPPSGPRPPRACCWRGWMSGPPPW